MNTNEKREELITKLEVLIADTEWSDIVDLSPEDARDILELLKAQRPRQRKERMLPCTCGCKRREHWTVVGPNPGEELRCMKCGFSARGRNAADAVRQWNKAVKGETDNEE